MSPRVIGMTTVAVVAAALALALALSVLTTSCGRLANVGLPARPKSLRAVEIRNYRGKNLSSVDDFVENSIRGPQRVDRRKYRLKVAGLVRKPLSLPYAQVVKSHRAYRKVVTLNCVEGWSVSILWEGVLLRDLLDDAGVKPDAKVVILRAYDGYSSSFPVRYFYDKDILMAYKVNGVTLPPERGFPFMLVAEDKWGYKWVKWITDIELSDDTSYRGYWESRGYSNEGDLNKSFFTPQR